mgnify:FL=1
MKSGRHIVSSFDDDLIAIQAKISEMGGVVEELLRDALRALRKRDMALAEHVIERDKVLDEMELSLEEMATHVIALRQPMAQDLRVLISAIKIASTLERIGDLAKNIARRAIYLSEAKPIKVSNSIVQMGKATRGHLSEILDAHAQRDADLAVDIWTRDAEIDDMYNAIFREVVTYMMEDGRMIGLGSQLLFVAKNLERIGDHTTHIAEMIYYVVKGEPLGDDRPKGDPVGLDIGV